MKGRRFFLFFWHPHPPAACLRFSHLTHTSPPCRLFFPPPPPGCRPSVAGVLQPLAVPLAPLKNACSRRAPPRHTFHTSPPVLHCVCGNCTLLPREISLPKPLVRGRFSLSCFFPPLWRTEFLFGSGFINSPFCLTLFFLLLTHGIAPRFSVFVGGLHPPPELVSFFRSLFSGSLSPFLVFLLSTWFQLFTCFHICPRPPSVAAVMCAILSYPFVVVYATLTSPVRYNPGMFSLFSSPLSPRS